ncbi:YiiX family permuted papain-like enzyme [Flavobacterium sp.]|uniref:YiiX family permuted papain-like enzyme n=1 Tax=Flavobacterium sp. TaxID=239 RepID=UPI003D0B156A
MRKIIFLCTIILATISISCKDAGAENKSKQDIVFKDGDIIFQTSESSQCEAVRLATQSKFSHCGIIFTDRGENYVLEAVQPVKITPLKTWIQHGRDQAYLVKRLKMSAGVLSSKQIVEMKIYGKKLLHKDYDLYFEWSDDKIYCSELVWKIYEHGAHISLCPFKKLKSFDLSAPQVQQIMQERYGTKIPLEEQVIAPSQLAESEKLETIFDNYTF